MFSLAVRGLLCVGVLFVFPLWSQVQERAGQTMLRVAFDRDQDVTTGCDYDPGTGQVQSGVDFVLEVEVDANVTPPLVTDSRLLRCDNNGNFVLESNLGGGWSVGENNGVMGGDVVEAALPLNALWPNLAPQITVWALNANGQDTANSAVVNLPNPIPTLGTWGLLFFIFVIMIAGLVIVRRNKALHHSGMISLLFVTCLLFMAISDRVFQLDGQVGDWDGIDPVITDEAGDGVNPMTDLLAIFACPSSSRLFLRFDLTNISNTSPVASDDTATTDEDMSVQISVLENDFDNDGDVITLSGITQPMNGTTQIINGDPIVIEYIPAVDFFGDDSFTYTVEDPAGAVATATVSVTVVAINDAPTAINLSNDSLPENEPVGTAVGTFTSDDVDDDTHVYTLVSGAGDSGNASFNIVGDQLQTAESFDFESQESYSIRVQSDDQMATIQQVFTVTITNVAEPPTLDLDSGTAGTDFAANFVEDSGPTAIVGTVVIEQQDVVDVQSANVTLSPLPEGALESLAVNTGATGIAAMYDSGTGVLALSGAAPASDYQSVLATLTYNNTSQAPSKLPRTVTVVINDGTLNSNTATSTVSVTGSNDNPTAVDDMFTVDEDSSNNMLSVLLNDSSQPDNPKPIVIMNVGTPDQGGNAVVSGDFTQVIYTPAADYAGVETFTYTLSDNNGGTAVATVTVQVNNVNDPPTATDDAYTVDEDSVDNDLDVLANDLIAPDTGETLTVTSVGVTDQGGTAMIAGGGASITYTPAADFAGIETFTYTVSDGGLTDTATVTVTVTGVDDPVTANDDMFATNEDAATTTGDVLTNDEAPDGGLAVMSVDAVSALGATVSDNGNGTFDYDGTAVNALQALDDGETSNDTFTYTATDSDGDTDTATVTIEVNGVNDAPIADATSQMTMAGDTVTITLTGSDVDVENLTFEIASGPSSGSLGAITPLTATSAQVDYTHDGSASMTDAFTFTVDDGTVTSAAETVSISIGDPPMANDDGSVGAPLLVQENSFLDIDVAANDTDPQGNGTIDLASVMATDGTRGTTASIGGGEVRYTATMSETGADSFTYTIDDDEGNTSNSATVFVEINAAPVADDDMYAIAEGSTEMLDVLTGDTDSDDSIDITTVTIVTDVPGGEGTTSVNVDGTVTYTPGAFTGATSFTYEVSDTRGGTSNIATVNIDVSPLPMATDDTFNVVGHTTVSVSASLGLLSNDTDDGMVTATAGTFATDNGGSITIAADGSFTYTSPGPAAVTPPTVGGTDSYTYEVEDDVMGMDTATVTFTYESVVWFVDNTNASGTDDGSLADPFDTLAEAEAAAGENETIFVFVGDGTTTGQDEGIELQNGQSLLGEFIGLSVDVDGMGPGVAIDLVAANVTKPVLTNTVTHVVVLADDNVVEGFELLPQMDTAVFGMGMVMGMKRTLSSAEKPRDQVSRERGAWHQSSFVETHLVEKERKPRGWLARQGEEFLAAHASEGSAGAGKVGGNTRIANLDVFPQTATAEGLVFVGQEGTLTVENINITGPMGSVGLGFDYEIGTADLMVNNVSITNMDDCFYIFDGTGTHTLSNLTLQTDLTYAFGLELVDSVTLTGTNTASALAGDAVLLVDTVLGAAGLVFDTVTSELGVDGFYLETVSGGPVNVTGAVNVTDMVEQGVVLIDVSSNVTFDGALTLDMFGDDGIELRDLTGSVVFNSTVNVMNAGDDGIDIEDAYVAGVTFADTITITGSNDAGIEFNGQNAGAPTGNVSFMGTVDIDQSGFAGVYMFDALSSISFATLDVDTAGVGGMILDDADITAGETLTITQLDLNPGAGSQVGLGIAESSGRIDVNGGTLENVEGEVLGLITSMAELTFTGSLTQSNAGNPLILADAVDASMVTFEAGTTLQDTGGSGLQFGLANGTYLFEPMVSVSGNDDEGIFVGSGSSGTMTFNGDVVLNTGTGDALSAEAGSTATLNFNANLDIDTTSGVGIDVLGGTLNIDPSNAAMTDVTATAAQAINIDNTLIHIHLDSVSSTGAAAEGVALSNLPAMTTGFTSLTTTVDNPTGIGLVLDTIAAGTYAFGPTVVSNRNATGISIAGHSGTSVTFADVDVLNPNSAPGNAFAVLTSSAAVQLDSLDASDTVVSTVRADGGGDGVPDNESYDGNGIFLLDHTGGFTITAMGVQGDGGLLENMEGDGVSLIRSSNVTLNDVTINNIGTDNALPATVDNAGVYGIDLSGSLTITNSTISRFQDGNVAGTNSRGVYIRNDNTDFTEVRVTDTTFFNDNALLGDDGILLETFNTVNGAIVVESLVATGDANNFSDFSQISGNGVQVNKNGAGDLSVSITNSTFRDTIAGGGFGGLELSGAGSGIMSVTVDGCTLNNLYPLGVNNGGMVTLFAGGSTDYDATVNNCSISTSAGRGGIRAATGETVGDTVVDFDITLTNNVIDDTDREGISVFVRGPAVPAASGQEADILIQDNQLGQTTAVAVSGREGIEFRTLDDAKIVNLTMIDNNVTNFGNSTSDETVDIDAEDSATLNLTMLGNSMTRTGTSGESLEVTSEDAGVTLCLDLNSSNTNPNTAPQDMFITETAGNYSIEDIGGAGNDGATVVKPFLEARNTATVTAVGTFDSCDQNP